MTCSGSLGMYYDMDLQDTAAGVSGKMKGSSMDWMYLMFAVQ